MMTISSIGSAGGSFSVSGAANKAAPAANSCSTGDVATISEAAKELAVKQN